MGVQAALGPPWAALIYAALTGVSDRETALVDRERREDM
jgi:hypothetical protein